MSKQFKNKTVLSKHLEVPITWKDIKHFKFEDEDEIRAEYVEPFYSENNSYDEHYIVEVIRKVIETDEEYERRIKSNELFEKRNKELRYENYLKLKKEFENE